jgi:hypothetical protein
MNRLLGSLLSAGLAFSLPSAVLAQDDDEGATDEELALPDEAAPEGREASERGLGTANRAREQRREFGQETAREAREAQREREQRERRSGEREGNPGGRP